VVTLHAVGLDLHDFARLDVHESRVHAEVAVEVEERAEHDIARPNQLADLRGGLGIHPSRVAEVLLVQQPLNVFALHDAGGRVLGALTDSVYEQQKIQLSSGDRLLLFTDGVTEVRNGSGEEFGEQRLVEAVKQHREQTASSIVTSVIADVQRFSPQEQHDDITLIVAKCRGNA